MRVHKNTLVVVVVAEDLVDSEVFANDFGTNLAPMAAKAHVDTKCVHADKT